MQTTLSSSNFSEIYQYFEKLPISVREFSSESFRQSMQNIEAKKVENIVYLWCCEKPIPRLNGESNILYIGQSKKSFSHRYKNYEKYWINTKANSLKLNHVLNAYGNISFWICDSTLFGDTSSKAEGQLLWWYFQNHLEFPPFNYSQTKIRNDFIEIDT